jgi:hypothetical protein
MREGYLAAAAAAVEISGREMPQSAADSAPTVYVPANYQSAS